MHTRIDPQLNRGEGDDLGVLLAVSAGEIVVTVVFQHADEQRESEIQEPFQNLAGG